MKNLRKRSPLFSWRLLFAASIMAFGVVVLFILVAHRGADVNTDVTRSAVPASIRGGASLPSEISQSYGIDPTSISEAGAFASVSRQDAIFTAARTGSGLQCIFDVGSKSVGVGCGFSTPGVMWVETSDGGLDAGSARNVQIVGVAPAGSDVEIVDSHGKTHPAQRSGSAFLYRSDPHDIAAGIAPSELRTRDSQGHAVVEPLRPNVG